MNRVVLPATCPVCAGALRVEKLRCDECETAIEGRFATEPLTALTVGERAFAEAFLLAGGNLKALGEELGVSYPTLRGRLDELIDRLRSLKGLAASAASTRPRTAAGRPEARTDPRTGGRRPAEDALARKERILAMIEAGEISAAEGKARLRGK